ncbi:GNAT family N-acetyltransferase [Bacillus sp. JJ1562]|uniref:GNAT family N-acetyltransferase n=1 Tax=Bacillus sp. JJ1562 TaxID=3122960 RepID=UPI003002B309
MVKYSRIDLTENILDKVANLYKIVWDSADPLINERLLKHANYDGFKGIVILSDEEEAIGFSYGYTSLPGQFYHEKLAKEFSSEEYNKWLKDCFEFVELAVHPDYRQQGFGRILVNELLQDIKNKTVILTTQVNNRPARSLYESLNWICLKDQFFPSVKDNPYIIMGKKL